MATHSQAPVTHALIRPGDPDGVFCLLTAAEYQQWAADWEEAATDGRARRVRPLAELGDLRDLQHTPAGWQDGDVVVVALADAATQEQKIVHWAAEAEEGYDLDQLTSRPSPGAHTP